MLAVVHFHHARTTFHGTHGGFPIALGRHIVLAVIHTCHAWVAVAHSRHVMLAVVHACHARFGVAHSRHVVHAVVHCHPHVAMGKCRRRVHRRDIRQQRRIGCQGATGITGAVNRLCKDRVRAVIMRFDQYVVGLGHADAELVHADWFDVLAISGHNRHLQPRNPHIEEGHRRCVDEAQFHPLATLE